ncbi:unnamed protein product [Polarella glacialis]|uniref:Uncharacterized protein n=1 Tax=Polarella glacialis TaxID=89957 RepID=A0A813HE28_POLGL|nr:unnamed protein product [Polarella glacialis]
MSKLVGKIVELNLEFLTACVMLSSLGGSTAKVALEPCDDEREHCLKEAAMQATPPPKAFGGLRGLSDPSVKSLIAAVCFELDAPACLQLDGLPEVTARVRAQRTELCAEARLALQLILSEAEEAKGGEAAWALLLASACHGAALVEHWCAASCSVDLADDAEDVNCIAHNSGRRRPSDMAKNLRFKLASSAAESWISLQEGFLCRTAGLWRVLQNPDPGIGHRSKGLWSAKVLAMGPQQVLATLKGKKLVENRFWQMTPGWYALHVGSARGSRWGREACLRHPDLPCQEEAIPQAPFGHISGLVHFSEVRTPAECGNHVWASGPLCHIVSKTIQLEWPFWHRGNHGLWQPCEGTRELILEQLPLCRVRVNDLSSLSPNSVPVCSTNFPAVKQVDRGIGQVSGLEAGEQGEQILTIFQPLALVQKSERRAHAHHEHAASESCQPGRPQVPAGVFFSIFDLTAGVRSAPSRFSLDASWLRTPSSISEAIAEGYNSAEGSTEADEQTSHAELRAVSSSNGDHVRMPANHIARQRDEIHHITWTFPKLCVTWRCLQKMFMEDSPAIASARNRDLEANYGALRQLPADEVLAAVDHNGCGCLHWAAGNGDVDTCRYLVELSEGSATHALTWNQRTPLHYAARNGQTEACQWLAQQSADVNALARDEVSPLQLAVWQNHLETCRWFVEEAGVDPLQRNRFGCSIAHWVSQAPRERAGDPQGEALLPLARWLRLRGCDFSATQEHGHNALHKAGWSGHAELCRWLRDECGLRDGKQDEAGNFAADLAEMAGHHALADWLRAECSAARAASCRVLGVDEDADSCVLREAYLRLIRCTHPDSRSRKTPEAAEVSGTEPVDFDEFTALHGAYRHLVRDGGRGSQRNPRHEERLMLCDVGGDSSARLLPQPTSGTAQFEQSEEQAPGGGPGLADIQLFKS